MVYYIIIYSTTSLLFMGDTLAFEAISSRSLFQVTLEISFL